jgi:predicted RND superfamily exporter protein
VKKSWFEFVVDRPIWVLTLGVIILVASAVGTKNLYFRGDYKVFFEEDNPQRLQFEQMQDTFSKNDGVSLIVAPKARKVFSFETLKLIQEITEQAEYTPFSSKVDSITNFQHTWSEDDDLIVEDLIYDLSELNTDDLTRLEGIALNEPSLVNRLISPSGKVTVINISVNLPDGDQTEEVEEITKAIEDMTGRFKIRYPEHDFYHTGVVYMSHSFSAAAKQDFESIIPLMFLTIILIIWFLLKTFVGTLATLVIIVTSILVTMGAAGWFGLFISTATVNVPTMVMTLAVADSVHVLASMLFNLRSGQDKRTALLNSLSLNKLPIIITSITTSIGFLTLNFSEVPILADLGNLTALGVMVACLFSLTILPALIMLMPLKVRAQESRVGTTSIEKIGDWVIHRHKVLLPISLLTTVIFIGFCFDNRLNDVPTAYFDESTLFRQSTDFQQSHVSGMTSIDFAIFTGQDSAINVPQNMQIIEDFSQWLRLQPEVDHVSSVTDTYKRLNKNMNYDNEDYYRLPHDRELAAQFMLLYEMSLPYGLDINNHLDMSKSATRVMTMLQNIGSDELIALENRAKAWFTQRAPELKITAASPGLMFAHISDVNMVSMLQGSVIALLLISFLLIFALRSIKMGLISLVPNLLPACIGFGLWGVFSGEVNLGLSVVLSMTLGIIVDDTVHFLTKYNHARQLGDDATKAVRYAFSSVGKALWITTLVLTVGFSILMLSPFALNAQMGMLTAIIILVALVVAFFFLPPFLL